MTSKYTVNTPAKINIGLRVLSKRKDGYHNIETIFYPVDLFDTVTLKIRSCSKDIIKVKLIGGKKIALPAINEWDNICYKAAALFLSVYDVPGFYRIDIAVRKNIPVGAGLGGGSSDAAAVLKILAKHFSISKQQMKLLPKLALALGSDVPYFLEAKPAYASSRGEKLSVLSKFKIPYKILIVNPGLHVSTPWAYKALQVKKSKKKVLHRINSFGRANQNIFINDFERVVFKKYPKIEKIKKQMYDFRAEFSLMSGSGSTVYGFYKKEADLKSASKKFPKNYFILTA